MLHTYTASVSPHSTCCVWRYRSSIYVQHTWPLWPRPGSSRVLSQIHKYLKLFDFGPAGQRSLSLGPLARVQKSNVLWDLGQGPKFQTSFNFWDLGPAKHSSLGLAGLSLQIQFNILQSISSQPNINSSGPAWFELGLAGFGSINLLFIQLLSRVRAAAATHAPAGSDTCSTHGLRPWVRTWRRPARAREREDVNIIIHCQSRPARPHRRRPSTLAVPPQ